jgi:hypothetical protein
MDDEELRDFLEPLRRLLTTDEKEIQSRLERVRRSVAPEDYELIRRLFEQWGMFRQLLDQATDEDDEEQV